jgi:hypothetical protein
LHPCRGFEAIRLVLYKQDRARCHEQRARSLYPMSGF